MYELLRDTAEACANGDILTRGAALAYYTIFAIAPLFIIALAIAGFWFGEEAARRELFGQLNQLIGKDGGDAIQAMVVAANKTRGGFWAASLAAGTLVVAATGVFAQLQNSLNQLWQIRQLPGRGLRSFIRHRLLSFAMVLGIGFLLLVSLVLSAGLAALGNFMTHYISGRELFLKILDTLVSLGIITVLFALIFKFIPDVKIAWRDVWLGAFITAILFNIGKFIIGVYIARSSVTSIYGTAGSLVVVLLWVYYSSQILFVGAQFTKIYAAKYGVKPEAIHGTRFSTAGAK